MALATGIFTTNCTLPPEGINWVSNPNVRSTLTILWTSLLTIFLCTWTVQHLSIPPPNEPRLATVWRKVKWMMVVIIAPEFMVGKSCSDWVAAVASESCPAMQEHANKSNTRWTTTHAFYANMGGFLVHGLNCNTALNMDECTCAMRVPPTTRDGSTRSLSARTLTEPPAIPTTPPAGQNIASTGPPSLTPQAGATPDPISTDVDVDGIAVPPAQFTVSSGLTPPTPQAGAALEPSSTDVEMDTTAAPPAKITPVVDVKPVASLPAAGETLHPAATDADIETATYVPHVRVTPAADKTTATSAHAACEDDEESTGLTSPTRQATEETLDPTATDDIEATKKVPSAQTTPETDEATQVAYEDEEAKGLTSPVAQAEALLEPSVSLKEVDIEAARTIPSAQIHRLADGKTTTLGNRLKKRILHRHDRNHVWGERPPRNLVDHGRSWYNVSEQIDFPFAANSAQLCVLLSSGIIGQLPSITEAQIKDKSKEDVVVKVLALLQVLQLVVELIIRKVYGLATSPLEIAALGFSVCAGLTYLFWLGKPKDIHLPTDVYITRDLNDADKEQVRWLNSHGFFKIALLNDYQSTPKRYIPHDFYNTEAILRHAYSISGRDNIFMLSGEDVGFTVGGLIFGAFHCFAWNFVFPTLIERTLWRVSSVFTSASVPLFYVIWYIVNVFTVDRPDRRWPWRARALLLRPFFLLYLVCRLVIIVEAVRSLFFLPQAAFISTWSVNIPHLG